MVIFTDRKCSNISQEAYYVFHSVDRRLYASLVDVLCRDLVEAIQMMAIWFWLEKAVVGCSSIAQRILTFPLAYINIIGDEALMCWDYLGDTNLVNSSFALPVPYTDRVLQQKIDTDFLRKMRRTAIGEINGVITRVFPKCLKDIWERAMERNSQMAFLQPLGFERANYVLQAAPPQRVKTEVPSDERTLFVTFSKGYPVSEWEVRDFMKAVFGDCIESLYMDPVAEGAQPLFAKIVLNDPRFMNIILQDRMGKFTINGKHVWMRKFVPKCRGGGSV